MEFNRTLRVGVLMLTSWCIGAPLSAHESAEPKSKPAAAKKDFQKKPLDRSGQPRSGKASYYGKNFFGRTMADGTPMDPNSNIAASRTLPIGTKAEVTNLENGKSAIVEIRDRGPYIEGRIIDLTPKTAEELDMTTEGVVRVEVTPIEVPQRDGSIKLGAAADRSIQVGAAALGNE
jgi:rare lipoprotein A